jgi:glutathione S-transferase
MDIINDVWLKDGKKYLMGEEMSIADLSCVCELMQVRCVPPRACCTCDDL